MLQYYLLLRSVLRAKPHLRRSLTRCRHCGIFFLTHPRNAGRQDLRCPFGCREAHRKQASAQRSAAYYREPKGRSKKSQFNQRRPRQYCPPTEPSLLPARRRGRRGRRPKWNRPMVRYVCMIATLIENRPISARQVLGILRRKLRQHTFASRHRIDQTLARLNRGPP